MSLRGGWMKVPAQAWEPIHYSARWTPENPAPEWWAQFDLSWQIDRDDVMSERKLAAFLGWNRRSSVTLLEEVGAVLGTREPKASQKRASTRKVSVPEVIQSGTVESVELLDRGAKVDPEVSQVWAKSEPPRARAFPLPEADSEADPDSEKKEIHVPPVPVSTTPPAAQEPPVCAPSQATQTSVPESTAKEATNTQPVLFPVASAGTVGSPKAAAPKKKAANKVDNSEAIGKVWAQYRIHKPLCEVEPTKEAIEAIGPALSRAAPEKLILLIRWAFDCNDEKGQHLWLQGKARGSERKYQGIGNLMVVSKVAERLEEAIPWAEREAKGPAFGGHPTLEGVVFGRVEPKQAKPSALPPNFQKQQKVCGIDAAADMWDYAQELKTNNQQQSEAM